MRRSHPLAAFVALALGATACGDDGPEDTAPSEDAATAPTADATAGAPKDAGNETDELPLVLSPDAEAADAWGLLAVDARDAAAHATERLPGAVSVDVAMLRADIDGVPGQVPPPADVARALAAAGVARLTPVLVYAAASDLTAARLLWTLDYMGHGPVHLLDGGIGAWRQADLPTEGGSSELSPRQYPDAPIDAERRVDADWVLAHLDDPGVVLIDARSSAEYEAGHIPGALGFDWQRNVSDGRLKPRDELTVLYAEVSRDATVVVYCQTGSRASMAYVTLRHLGYPDVRLYDGSMAEWTADPGRPLE